MVITTGTNTVEGAVQAGMGFALFQLILDYQIFKRIQGIEFVLFAIGAFTYAQAPRRDRRVPEDEVDEPGRAGCSSAGTLVGAAARLRSKVRPVSPTTSVQRRWRSGCTMSDPGGRAASNPLLEARSVSKRFGGITALHDISISITPGRSSVSSVRTARARRPCSTVSTVNSVPRRGTSGSAASLLNRMPAYKRARLGIARTFQRVEVFPALTVSEHFLVACRAKKGDASLWRDLLNMSRPPVRRARRWRSMLELVGLIEVADTPVAALSLGSLQARRARDGHSH